MKPTRCITFVHCAASALLTLTSLSAQPTEAENTHKKLRVGIIAPLSGGVATWGQSIQHGIELANAISPTPAELFFEDEQTCVPTKALSAFHALTTQRKIDILVTSCLGGARAIAPLAKAKGLPLFISGRSSSEFQRAHPNALSWLSLLDSEGKAIGDLVRTKGWSRGVAMVSSDYFGAQFLAGIRAGVRELQPSFSLLAKEYSFETPPIGPEVISLLRQKPDVVFMMLSDQSAAFVAKQLRAMQFKGTIVLQSSMLQTTDQGARATFKGALQQKFALSDEQFMALRGKIAERLGQQIADDFVFSYDGFAALLKESSLCLGTQDIPLDTCLQQRMRNEAWRTGASGTFRYMKDGSTERPMIFKTITEAGFEGLR
jgi:ABC-type branched-subunit amino acid transport system substrate-binding protein